jgi:hypothetical protein
MRRLARTINYVHLPSTETSLDGRLKLMIESGWTLDNCSSDFGRFGCE